MGTGLKSPGGANRSRCLKGGESWCRPCRDGLGESSHQGCPDKSDDRQQPSGELQHGPCPEKVHDVV